MAEERYQKPGGKIKVIVGPGKGHYPLTPNDPKAAMISSRLRLIEFLKDERIRNLDSVQGRESLLLSHPLAPRLSVEVLFLEKIVVHSARFLISLTRDFAYPDSPVIPDLGDI
jgi:hypothetical protein